MSDRLRIVVTGYILRWPLGGNAWPYLQYVLGLSQLGHEVYYLEESGDSPYCCYNAETGENNTDPSYGLRFTTAVFDSVGLGGNWAYYDVHALGWLGPCADRILELCKTADVLLRIPAMADSLRPWLEQIPVRALVDIDPVFTQLRHLHDPAARRDAQCYNAYFSFGENIPRGTSSVPDDGLAWIATRPPIVLDAWPVTPGPEDGKFTTVMKWESYRCGEHNGVYYGMKAESFGPYMDLPQVVGPILELTAGGGETPVSELKKQGWSIRNPLEITKDLWTYQRYIQASRAEFGIAKHGYVVSHSGWLSDRSGAYLASGRPILVQDTGFSDWLETGAGIIPFTTPDEAAAGIEEINSRYTYHCRAALDMAREYFDSQKILQRLLEDAIEQANSTGLPDKVDALQQTQTEHVKAGTDTTGESAPANHHPSVNVARHDTQRKVFGIGLSRTGTTSLGVALVELGIKTIHFPTDSITQQEITDWKGHLTILEQYDGVVDIPIIPIYKKLDHAYPGSKFILTVRDIEAWLISINSSLAKTTEVWPSLREQYRTFSRFIYDCVYGSMEFNRDEFIGVYTRHLEDVTKYFRDRPTDLLIMEITAGDGWEKLCPFLEIPIPERPFPFKNDQHTHIGWFDTLARIKHEIEVVVSAGEMFVLIDQHALHEVNFDGRTALPFLDGGKPSDSSQALDALAQQRNSGVNYLVIASPAFWWFDYYTEFGNYLRSQYPCLLESREVVIFSLVRE